MSVSRVLIRVPPILRVSRTSEPKISLEQHTSVYCQVKNPAPSKSQANKTTHVSP